MTLQILALMFKKLLMLALFQAMRVVTAISQYLETIRTYRAIKQKPGLNLMSGGHHDHRNPPK